MTARCTHDPRLGRSPPRLAASFGPTHVGCPRSGRYGPLLRTMSACAEKALPMDPRASALAAWIAFHAELGVDLDALLLPGATADEIAAAEKVLGHALPEDVRTLYRHADRRSIRWTRRRLRRPDTTASGSRRCSATSASCRWTRHSRNTARGSGCTRTTRATRTSTRRGCAPRTRLIRCTGSRPGSPSPREQPATAAPWISPRPGVARSGV